MEAGLFTKITLTSLASSNEFRLGSRRSEGDFKQTEQRSYASSSNSQLGSGAEQLCLCLCLGKADCCPRRVTTNVVKTFGLPR